MLKKILKYWKLGIALILIGLSLYIHQTKFKVEQAAYEAQVEQIQQMEEALKKAIEHNKAYADVQDDLEAAKAELDVSRRELYSHFPVELREEDQIMYVLYLETIFGTEINFAFNQPVDLVMLNDGTRMQGLLIDVNYETTYEGFKDMIRYLSDDDRIASVYTATIEYDAKTDKATGTLSLVLYLMYNSEFEYTDPDIAVPEVGKDNLFE